MTAVWASSVPGSLKLATGRLKGPWFPGRARRVDDPEVVEPAYAALRAKYGWQMALADFFSRLSGRIDGRAILELELEPQG